MGRGLVVASKIRGRKVDCGFERVVVLGSSVVKRCLKGTSGGRSHGRPRDNTALPIAGRHWAVVARSVSGLNVLGKDAELCVCVEISAGADAQGEMNCARPAVQSCWSGCERIIPTCFSMWHLGKAPPCEMLNWTWDDSTGSVDRMMLLLRVGRVG